jgi:acyl-CoA thioesterase-1
MNVRLVTLALPVCCLLALTMAACGSRGETPVAGDAQATTTAAPALPAARPRIVVLGDSLTAGLGIPVANAYPSLLQQRVDAAGLRFEVVNAGVSGDTSAGGLSRLDWALQGDVRLLIVALGGNDGLRGLPVEQLRRNLAAIIERARTRGIAVILAGMEAPPNFGRDYIVAFHQVYPSVAAEYHVAFVPFLLEGVAGHADLNQNDGLHPTAAGARVVADNVWAVLEPLAKQQQQRGTRSEGRPGS